MQVEREGRFIEIQGKNNTDQTCNYLRIQETEGTGRAKVRAGDTRK